MDNYDDLIQRLTTFSEQGYPIAQQSADAIRELVEELNANRAAANESYKQGLADGREEMRERAEKEETDE